MNSTTTVRAQYIAGKPMAVTTRPSTKGPTPVPMSSMRRTIGQRLKASYSESPHYRVSVNADIGALLALRSQINASRLDVKVSVNDLVVAAVAAAPRLLPERWTGTGPSTPEPQSPPREATAPSAADLCRNPDMIGDERRLHAVSSAS